MSSSECFVREIAFLRTLEGHQILYILLELSRAVDRQRPCTVRVGIHCRIIELTRNRFSRPYFLSEARVGARRDFVLDG